MQTESSTEPLHVSARFHTAVKTAVLELERQAARDEQMIQTLVDPGHQRRQRQLVDAQLLKAFRLHEMLNLMLIKDADSFPTAYGEGPRRSCPQ
jgi:late competence protein required for DNA uptake (superfamily II DNA/RNA helicase)